MRGEEGLSRLSYGTIYDVSERSANIGADIRIGESRGYNECHLFFLGGAGAHPRGWPEGPGPSPWDLKNTTP